MLLKKKEDLPILSGLTKVSNLNPKEGKKAIRNVILLEHIPGV